ncbi:MAG: ABC transporter permease [Chloroflexi bacterium]|nr:ABC transporter permease [Chloroflexota bacterium]
MNALLIARLTLKEAARKRLLLLVVIGSVLFLTLFGVGLILLLGQVRAQMAGSGAGRQGIAVFSAMMTLMGFYMLNTLAGLSAVFISVNAISGDIDSGTVHALLAHPLRRRDVILGKWLGYASVLALYVVVMSLALMAIAYFVTDFLPPAPLAAIGLMVLVTLVLLSLSTLGGTFLPTLANGVGLFLLYGLAWLGGMVETLGAALRSDTMVHIGIVVSLLIPSDVLWRSASFYLQPAAILAMQNVSTGGVVPFASATPPAAPMLIYTVLYTLGALGLAIAVFNRRDL